MPAFHMMEHSLPVTILMSPYLRITDYLNQGVEIDVSEAEWFQEGIEKAIAAISGDEPLLREVMNGNEGPDWIEAMETELSQIKRLHTCTWDLVEAPPDANVIPSRYVFYCKCNFNEIIEQCKACCIAKGYMQQFGVDYTDTFTPSVCPATLRILLSLIVQYNASIYQIDVKDAYINSYLKNDEVIYIQLPFLYLNFCELPPNLCNS